MVGASTCPATLVKRRHRGSMATMNISLGDDLRDFVEREVREGAFSSSSE